MGLPLRPARYKVLRRRERGWWAQRIASRELRAGGWCLGVAGRQTGKTWWGADLTGRRALRTPGDGYDRGQSLVLSPTKWHALWPRGALMRTLERAGATWHESRGYFECPNGHRVWVRSTERPDSMRGLTVDTTLWLDEAALISSIAWENALACLVTAQAPTVVATTTPRGKANWVYAEWTSEDEDYLRAVFRTLDSPVANPEVVRRLRRRMTGSRASQELDAVFTDDARAPFPPDVVERMLARPLGPPRGRQRTLGLDFGKERDWTVACLMNEHAEAWMLGRWRHVDWPTTTARVIQLARDHDALVVVDEQHGGGYGGALADFIEEAIGKHHVMRVRTANRGVKGRIVETAMADAEHGIIGIDPGHCADEVRHELLFYASTREVVGGVERFSYGAPPGKDEHDDCVIALCLANYGRRYGWSADHLDGDFGGFGGVAEDGGLPPLAGLPPAAEADPSLDDDDLAGFGGDGELGGGFTEGLPPFGGW